MINIQSKNSNKNIKESKNLTSSIDIGESFEDKFLKIINLDSSRNIVAVIENEFIDHSKILIRALVIAFCRSCLDLDRKLNITMFLDRCSILKLLINRNKALELEALYAIQEFDHRLLHQEGKF